MTEATLDPTLFDRALEAWLAIAIAEACGG